MILLLSADALPKVQNLKREGKQILPVCLFSFELTHSPQKIKTNESHKNIFFREVRKILTVPSEFYFFPQTAMHRLEK